MEIVLVHICNMTLNCLYHAIIVVGNQRTQGDIVIPKDFLFLLYYTYIIF